MRLLTVLFFDAIAAIIVGVYLKNPDLVTNGLGLAGMRHGISTEVAKIVTATNMKAEAVKEAPAVTQAIMQEARTPPAGDSAQLQQSVSQETPPANP